MLNSVDRDALSGWGAHVYVITKDKVVKRLLKGTYIFIFDGSGIDGLMWLGFGGVQVDRIRCRCLFLLFGRERLCLYATIDNHIALRILHLLSVCLGCFREPTDDTKSIQLAVRDMMPGSDILTPLILKPTGIILFTERCFRKRVISGSNLGQFLEPRCCRIELEFGMLQQLP